MRGLKRLFAVLSVALPISAAVAYGGESTDSLNNAVATFIASNFKAAMTNAIADLQHTGLDIDPVAVRASVIAQMSTPYDSTAHSRATATIERAVSEVSAAASENMLRTAAAQPGAQVLADGLVFRTLEKGTGASPSRDSTVTVRFKASLPDGTVIDEIKPGEEPLTCKATDLTKGFTEALTMMQAGGRYIITLPADLAYGKEGVDGVIPPDCAIQFEVDLLKFN